MKIAIVSDAVYPYHKGGKERRFFELTTRLAAKGHEVHMYCMKWWKGEEKVRVEHGVTLHAISRLYPLYTKNRRRSIRQGIMFGLSCLRLLWEDWDIIEVDHMPYFPLYFTRLVCWLKGKKMYATWNEVWGRKYWIEYMGGWSGAFAYVIERCSIALPDHFISISRHTTERLQSVYQVPAEKITTITPGLDTRSIQDIPASATTSDVLYAGRLLKHKNVDLLVKAIGIAARKMPDITCLIVGNGPEKKHLISLVEKMNLSRNIQFLNFLPHHHEVFGLMKSAKVFCLPSTREGFGMAVLEANACGLPAVVVQHPENAAQDLIEHDNGLVAQEDPKMVSTALLKLLTRPLNTRAVMAVAENYNWTEVVDRLVKQYRLETGIQHRNDKYYMFDRINS